jgi:hypothetical protein
MEGKIDELVRSGFRPPNLPPKSPSEKERHQAHVETILSQIDRNSVSSAIARDAEKRALDALWRTELMTGSDLCLTEQMRRLWAEYGLPSQFVRSVLWPWRSFPYPLTALIKGNTFFRKHPSLIELDVKRTLPFLGFVNDAEKSGLSISVLEDFSDRHPELGYTQGMSYVAVRLMMELDWDISKTRVCLDRILIRSPTVHCMYSLDLEKVSNSVGFVLDSICWENVSSLWQFFKRINFRPIEWFFLEWVLTLFVKNLSLKISGFIFDLFFLEGDVVLYKAAVAILALVQDKLMLETDVEHVRGIIGKVGDLVSDSEVFVKAYHEVTVTAGLKRIIDSTVLF